MVDDFEMIRLVLNYDYVAALSAKELGGKIHRSHGSSISGHRSALKSRRSLGGEAPRQSIRSGDE